MQGAGAGDEEEEDSSPARGSAWNAGSLVPGGCAVFSPQRALEDAAIPRERHHADGETKAPTLEGADLPTVPCLTGPELLLMEGVEKQDRKGAI